MKPTVSELVARLKEEKTKELLLPGSILDVVSINGEFYCVACYTDGEMITVLRRTRPDSPVFKCPHCAAIKVLT